MFDLNSWVNFFFQRATNLTWAAHEYQAWRHFLTTGLFAASQVGFRVKYVRRFLFLSFEVIIVLNGSNYLFVSLFWVVWLIVCKFVINRIYKQRTAHSRGGAKLSVKELNSTLKFNIRSGWFPPFVCQQFSILLLVLFFIEVKLSQ